MIGFFAFLFITILCSCLVFGCYRANHLQTSETSGYSTTILLAMLSAFISTILFQVVGYLVVGYLDPFFLIALIGGWIISFIISLIIGFLFLPSEEEKRRRKSENNGK